MRSKAWLAARVSLRLAGTASSAQRSRSLRSTRAAAPGLLAHAEVTVNLLALTTGTAASVNRTGAAAPYSQGGVQCVYLSYTVHVVF